MSNQRIKSIDAARGAAMFFVCLSHFSWVHLDLGGAHGAATWLTGISQIASPAFVIISGMLVGHLYRTGKSSALTSARLIDRALFLLTFGHVVLLIPNVLRTPESQSPLLWIFLTDVIAVALLAAAYLVPRTSPGRRAAAGLLIYGVSLAASTILHPPTGWLATAMDGILGTIGAGYWTYRAPLLPWFGIFLASTALGERLVDRRTGDVSRFFMRTGVALGSCAIALGLAVRAGFHAAQATAAIESPLALSRLDFLSSPWEKMLPSAGYMLVFGGAALLMILAVIGLCERRMLPRFTAWLALLGEGSLFIFMLQAWLYYSLMYNVRIPVTRFWPLLFLASLVVLTAAAHVWRRYGGNRLLSLRFARRPTSAPSPSPLPFLDAENGGKERVPHALRS